MNKKITITEILDDLRAADEITRRFERHYWLSSEDFYDLYQQGLLDDGEHTEEFSEWSAFHQIKMDREAALRELSQARVRRLKAKQKSEVIQIDPHEPTLALGA